MSRTVLSRPPRRPEDGCGDAEVRPRQPIGPPPLILPQSTLDDQVRASPGRLQATVAMHADADGLCAGCLQRGMFAAPPCPTHRQAQLLLDAADIPNRPNIQGEAS